MNENLKKLFLELYLMILSDSEVHPKELELLYALGKDKGVSEKEIQSAVFSPNDSLSLKSLSDNEKLTYLYYMAQIAWADGKIDDMEKETLLNTCKRFGFKEENVSEITDFLFSQAELNKTVDEVLITIKNL